jgi:hypothetical protein
MKKLNAEQYNTDKKLMPNYIRSYELLFSNLADQDIVLLELGIDQGGSLLMWRDFFKNGTIIGLDRKKIIIKDPTRRIKCFQGEQDDIGLLDEISRKYAPRGFDIIIDDCSHIGEICRTSFWHLFDNHLKPGGIYSIEDWGTGFWNSWPDGRNYHFSKNFKKKLKYRMSCIFNRKMKYIIPSHCYGMVGFIKELVDECGMGDITHEKKGVPPQRSSKIEYMQISHGIVIVVKKYA